MITLPIILVVMMMVMVMVLMMILLMTMNIAIIDQSEGHEGIIELPAQDRGGGSRRDLVFHGVRPHPHPR